MPPDIKSLTRLSRNDRWGACQRSSLGASPVPSCTSTLLQSDQLYYLVLGIAVSKSRHFQPTPVQTLDKTMNTVKGDGNAERGRVVKRENTRHISFLSFPHFYWLLLVIINL